MSAIAALRIHLAGIEAGTLYALDDGRTYFRFLESYAGQAGRPILSMLYTAETPAETAALLRDPSLAVNRGPGGGKLPPWFRGLLPEGEYRRHLEATAGIRRDDELALLAYCGRDLPGAVEATPVALSQADIAQFLTQGHDAYESASDQLPTPQAASLSGIQPKAALWLDDATGRYVTRGRLGASRLIGKLAGGSFPRMPEVEFASLTLARAAGVTTCEFELRPQSDLAFDPPLSEERRREHFLLVRRFDRNDAGGRVHMEDLAQAAGLDPDRKYDGSNAAIGAVLVAAGRTDALVELVRRIKVNELLGNFDAHVKNTSLLYADPRRPMLAPAYDVVAYAMVQGGSGVGLLNLPGDRTSRFLTPRVVRALANLWGCNERPLLEAAKETVDRALTHWPGMLRELPVDADRATRFEAHLDGLADVQAVRRRLNRGESDRARSTTP